MLPQRSSLASLLVTLLVTLLVSVSTNAEQPSPSKPAAAAQNTSSTRSPRHAQSPKSSAGSQPKAGLVVVAPHPDDEALMASGLILRALERHEPVSVIVITAGDFDCRVDARRRQAESIAGLAALGVSEKQVHFLGYPDGSLGRLGLGPLPTMHTHVAAPCRARTNSAKKYTAQGLESELQILLKKLNPETLVVTHPEDTHPDHAGAYAFVRRALNHLDQAPHILRAFVHTEDCWPTGGPDTTHCLPGRIAPTEPMPALSGELRGYEPTLRVPVPPSCLSPSLTENPKLRAIASHASQTRSDAASYLFAFARSEEIFFGEELVKSLEGKWTPLPPAQTSASPEMTMHAGEKLSLKQDSSSAWLVQLRRPHADQPTQLIVMSGTEGRYELSFHARHRRAAISRRTPDGALIQLQDWLLPHDTWKSPHSIERFELSLTPRGQPGAAELVLSHNDRLLGVAIDLDPLRQGDFIELDSTGNGDVLLSYSIAQSP